MSGPYWNQAEPDVDVRGDRGDSVKAACEVCGDDWELAIRPCWTEARGWWTGTRCVDGRACAKRAATPKPVDMPPATQPDAEEDPDAWI